MNKCALIIILLLLMQETLVGQSNESFLIRQVKMFDGENIIDQTDILIEEGRISQIKTNIEDFPAGAKVIDGAGKTLLPGLINAHVHAWLPVHLQDAADHGVTALLDKHAAEMAVPQLKALDPADGYAKYYTAGSAATVPGGHGTQYGYPVPTIDSSRSADEFVRGRVDKGSDYIKIIYEPQRPTLTMDQVEAVIRVAHQFNKLAVAHISEADEAVQIDGLEIDGFVHIWRDRVLTDQELTELSENKTFVIPTLSVLESAIAYYESQNRSVEMLSVNALQAEIIRLHNAGVKILAGTDPPNLGLNYSTSLFHEMELFAEAGLSMIEVLKTATSNISDAFGLQNQGRIQPGMLANFNLYNDDPTKDLSALNSITSTWISGVKIK